MAPLAYRNIFSTGRACYASMSGKHTVKIDVGAGGTEKRPLIHPRTDTHAYTHTHTLSLSSFSFLLLVASTFGQKDLGGLLVLVKTSVMLVPVSIYLRKDSLSGRRKSGEKIHWTARRKERETVLRGRNNAREHR